MAKLGLTNANISSNATDVSRSVASVQIETTVVEVDTSAACSTRRSRFRSTMIIPQSKV